MKIAIVGNLHGDLSLFKFINNNFDSSILLGNYVDSKKHSYLEQMSLLSLMMQSIKKGRTIALIGNHDQFYIQNGYDESIVRKTHQYLNYSFNENFGRNQIHGFFLQNPLLKYYVYFKKSNVLFTHAGFSKKLIVNNNFNKVDNIIAFVDSCIDFETSPIYYIGEAQGGPKPCGGILWCDWEKEFISIDGVRQVTCHTTKKYDDTKQGIKINQNSDINIGLPCPDGNTYEILIWDTIYNTFDVETISKKYVNASTY